MGRGNPVSAEWTLTWDILLKSLSTAAKAMVLP